MYEWIDNELAPIKTRRFHVVNTAPLPILNERAFPNTAILPPSYKRFVAQFGTAFFFRDGNGYLIRVSERPWIGEMDSKLICFGGYEDRDACFHIDLLKRDSESAVIEAGRVKPIADSFEAWLRRRFRSARRQYSPSQWREVVRGPSPFSRRELAIVAARRKFRWERTGVSPTGALRVKVTNDSNVVLPFLSIGVRSQVHRLQGGIWLPVGHVAPGTSAVVEHDGYKEQVRNEDVELFDLPDPQPEDRDRYWEFRPISNRRPRPL